MSRTPAQDRLGYKSFYRRNLPHIQPLNDSGESPSRFRELARRHFAMLESWLDKATVGPTWLADEGVAAIVVEALHHRDGKKYRLDAYSIMPNHVHTVFVPLVQNNTPEPLSSIMHSLERNTAKRANQLLSRSGAFWEHESFDHYIRNRAERKRIIKYLLQNPVKAGLAGTWEEWPWNYVKEPLEKPDAS